MASTLLKTNSKDVAHDVASRIGQLGEVWDGLSLKDQTLIWDVAIDAATVQLVAQTIDPADEEAVRAVGIERDHVKAQLVNLEATAAGRIGQAVWSAAAEVLGFAAQVLIGR